MQVCPFKIIIIFFYLKTSCTGINWSLVLVNELFYWCGAEVKGQQRLKGCRFSRQVNKCVLTNHQSLFTVHGLLITLKDVSHVKPNWLKNGINRNIRQEQIKHFT